MSSVCSDLICFRRSDACLKQLSISHRTCVRVGLWILGFDPSDMLCDLRLNALRDVDWGTGDTLQERWVFEGSSCKALLARLENFPKNFFFRGVFKSPLMLYLDVSTLFQTWLSSPLRTDSLLFSESSYLLTNLYLCLGGVVISEV